MPDQRTAAEQPPPSAGLLGPLAGMKVRKKLIILHTVFSLALAAVLLLVLQPAVEHVVQRGESGRALAVLAAGTDAVRAGTAEQLGIESEDALRVVEAEGRAVGIARADGAARVARDLGGGRFAVASARATEAREAVGRLFVVVVFALLAIYSLIALAIEVFVLPQQVWGPIARTLRADRAVKEGDREHELVPERMIPVDELGDIIRSRNETVRGLRDSEGRLADAFDQLETVAADLKRKNHLLETARRNLEGADRLASLGTMSAGIAHELNTPLAVAKGLIEKLARDPEQGLPESQARLLLRVVRRLERLSESLLDFARARNPVCAAAGLREIVDEAVTLVTLDRGVTPELVRVDVGSDVSLVCEADRLVQVFVNLIRNGIDHVRRSGGLEKPGPAVTVSLADDAESPDWLTVRVADRGPGIDPVLLPTLFEPFVSTTLDDRGTGLGLAVAEGIVREHAGTIIAHNRTDARGAVFEIVLPIAGPASQPDASDRETPTVNATGPDSPAEPAPHEEV